MNIILNNQTVNEIEPFIEKGWLTIQSTGSVTNMGAGNRIGNHIEELKRPYGFGNGFTLTINQLFFDD